MWRDISRRLVYMDSVHIGIGFNSYSEKRIIFCLGEKVYIGSIFARKQRVQLGGH